MPREKHKRGKGPSSTKNSRTPRTRKNTVDGSQSVPTAEPSGPGPSMPSPAVTSGLRFRIPPAVPPTSATATFPQLSHGSYDWNTHMAWTPYPPGAQNPAQDSDQNIPGFSIVNPLPSSPTFLSATSAFPYSAGTRPETRTAPAPVPHANPFLVSPTVLSTTPYSTGSHTDGGIRKAPPSVLPSTPRAESESSKSSSDSSGDERSHNHQRQSSKRMRISRRNPSFGHVEGVMVGNKEHKLPRKRQLRDLQSNAASANKRFKREVEELISRAERMSVETECWFFLCAQVPGAGPAYHYTSPRLRREALEDASAMVAAFQKTTYALNIAKRKDAKQIMEKYEKQITEERQRKLVAENMAAAAQTSREQAEAEVEKSRQEAELLQAELAAQKAIVERYRAQLASNIGRQNAENSPSQ